MDDKYTIYFKKTTYNIVIYTIQINTTQTQNHYMHCISYIYTIINTEYKYMI